MPTSERLLTLITHGPAQPNENEMNERTFKSLCEKLVKSRGTQHESQKNCKTLVKVLDAATKCTKSISQHQTYRNLHQTHTLMIFKNKGSQPIKKETPISPMLSNFGTKSNLTSSPPTLKQTLQALGAASTGPLTLISEAPRKRHQISLRRTSSQKCSMPQ